ncbi:hypothetical protein HBH75_209200 [Parastagonospora nodorum]|nr:hypothetical protein HBH75_209200 [Parastagonospora nodorum]
MAKQETPNKDYKGQRSYGVGEGKDSRDAKSNLPRGLLCFRAQYVWKSVREDDIKGMEKIGGSSLAANTYIRPPE